MIDPYKEEKNKDHEILKALLYSGNHLSKLDLKRGLEIAKTLKLNIKMRLK